MERFKNPKMVKIIASVLAVAFLLSVVAVFAGSNVSSAATNKSSIGYVDTQEIFKAHPDTAKARTELANATKKAEEEFNQKKDSLSDEEKKKTLLQYRQELGKKEQALVGDVMKKIDALTAEVAKEKGASVVLEKNNVFYGGMDLTQDVLNKIKQ